MDLRSFHIDWDLERQGALDQARHQRRLREAIKAQLSEIITEEQIITAQGGKILKIPIKTLEHYRFRFDPHQGVDVGQTGSPLQGDISLTMPSSPKSQGENPGCQDIPGLDYYEVDVSIDEIDDVLFSQLGLPDLQAKPVRTSAACQPQFKDVRDRGLMANLDKRRSLQQNLLRHARVGQPQIGPWTSHDLRFRTWQMDPEPTHNAVVIAMRDISGSMGDLKKRVARTFAAWMLKFLRSRYESVEEVFIVHHTEAREVAQEDFFALGESGGTKVSSAYALCQHVIETQYPAEQWNIYAVHFSDGDNWSETDNQRARDYLEHILPGVNLFGYAEIREGSYPSTLMNQFRHIEHPHFKTVMLSHLKDVYPALLHFFPLSQEA
ncbi:YeaH/YhbH family protein [Sulfobacillus thermosulfidooxidans]|uniref:DUF444 domain-containing protein n=1 Tax=Sulfobacillus thermosulfidooxidans TaxID=28034 RepID=A0A2T2WZQ0_SULTH|nr:DUF444 family protein [Sulfobacillus thermosulfidooxidans]PSR27696.1 MAG: DUF444 domain-containing protein [Sulfobacillus thermosulfidooxidans]